MSRTSSGSWNGAADIVDLDRYMKGGVRPHIAPRTPDSDSERLVVDCGGAGIRRGIADRRPSSSRTSVRRDKRYSHDSGLSDGSYVRRRVHRRAADNVAVRAHRERELRETRAAASSNSMKTFRATCERALRDQQEQIARVAELCERLIQAPPPRTSAPAPQPAPTSRDSSDISSSSRSTRVRSKKDRDKRLTEECKTYKIIMNRLDDLNRLLACRARPPPQQQRASSTGSVSVSDKIVGTDTLGHNIGVRKCGIPVAYALTSSGYNGASAADSLKTPSPRPQQPVLVERSTCSPSRQPKLAATRAHSIDIAPSKPAPALSSPPTQRRSGCLNVATESVMECGSNYSGSSAHAPHCQFDLDDPFHLYSQAKRLQTLHATTVRRPRTHSVDTGRTTTNNHSHVRNSKNDRMTKRRIIEELEN